MLSNLGAYIPQHGPIGQWAFILLMTFLLFHDMTSPLFLEEPNSSAYWLCAT